MNIEKVSEDKAKQPIEPEVLKVVKTGRQQLPDVESFADIMQLFGEASEIPEIQNPNPSMKKQSSKAKNHNNDMSKDKILAFKRKDIKGIRLFSHSSDPMNKEKEFKIDIDKLTAKDIEFLQNTVKNPEIHFNIPQTQDLQANLTIQDGI